MKRKTIMALIVLIAVSATACNKKNEEIMVQIPEVEIQEEVEYQNEIVEIKDIAEETESTQEIVLEEEIRTPSADLKIVESNISDNTLYVIQSGNYFSFNDITTFSIHPLGAKKIEVTEEIADGMTMTTNKIEGAITITGDTSLMSALYDNSENLYFKIEYKESTKQSDTYEIINYECFDIETKECYGKLSVEELKKLSNETKKTQLEKQAEMMKNVEELTADEIDISTLEPGKYYNVKNDFSPYVSTKDTYALYYFDSNELLELDDFSVFNNGVYTNFNGGKTLMVKLIDSNFIKEYTDEFDIINVSDIIIEGTYDSFAKDVVYNDTGNVVVIENENGDIYTIEVDTYITIDWMYDGNLTIK